MAKTEEQLTLTRYEKALVRIEYIFENPDVGTDDLLGIGDIVREALNPKTGKGKCRRRL